MQKEGPEFVNPSRISTINLFHYRTGRRIALYKASNCHLNNEYQKKKKRVIAVEVSPSC
jgi:hypothetical protein